MATYKKGFKKQNSELLLLKTIVVIIVSVILIVAVAFVYDSLTKWKNYDNYQTVNNYSDVFNMKDENGEEISDYVIYLYSNTCESCDRIKNDVLKIGNKLNRGDDMFFLLNTSNIEGDSNLLINVIDSSIVTPMIIIVKNGEYYEKFTGSTLVLSILESIQKSTYEPYN